MGSVGRCGPRELTLRGREATSMRERVPDSRRRATNVTQKRAIGNIFGKNGTSCRGGGVGYGCWQKVVQRARRGNVRVENALCKRHQRAKTLCRGIVPNARGLHPGWAVDGFGFVVPVHRHRGAVALTSVGGGDPQVERRRGVVEVLDPHEYDPLRPVGDDAGGSAASGASLTTTTYSVPVERHDATIDPMKGRTSDRAEAPVDATRQRRLSPDPVPVAVTRTGLGSCWGQRWGRWPGAGACGTADTAREEF